ncbi:MAG: FAD-dependent oxidoreductase [Deltaproteobacteria bacterium]|nr:FAD-dependent oxidoreductase [Deltaproteobacteria bacterium]
MDSDEQKVDLIVVGAGLAGLSCAYEAARSGLSVLLLERGDHPGAKNVSGGRIYIEPVRDLMPAKFWQDAPLERPVTSESLVLMGPSSSVTLVFSSESMRADPPSSYTILRSRFDRWFGEQVEASGAFVVPQAVATGLLRDGDRIAGVRAGEEDLEADVVVAADGALSFLAREAGLAPGLAPAGHALGIKEVIALDPGRIEDRLALAPGQGAARLFLGDLTRSMVGGGFLYSNRDSISLGLVVSLEDLGGRPDDADGSHALLDAFKERPEIRPLVEGGETVEYSAHLIPELPVGGLPSRVTDNLLVVGDAAGLVIYHGITVRGMDLAMASGVLAARACVKAREAGDFSASALSKYDRMLAESFVMRDVERHAAAPGFLARRRLYETYPREICDLLEDLFRVGPDGKERLYPAAWKRVRRTFLSMEGLKDLWAARKL